MVFVKNLFLVVFLVFVLPFSLLAQQVLTIDEAVSEAMHYVSERLSRGARVSVLHIESMNKDLTDYLIVECENYLSSNTFLRLADKRRLSVALQGKNVDNLSGLEEEELLEIGKMIGAQYIILGEFSKRGEFYRLVIQVLDVETAEVKGLQSIRVRLDEILADFTGETLAPAVQARDDSQDLARVKEMLVQIDARLESERQPEVVVLERSSNDAEMERMRRELDELRVAVTTPAPAPAPTARVSEQAAKKRSRGFLAFRSIITPSSRGVLNGIEFEIGGLKRDVLIFSGTSMYVGDPNFRDTYYDDGYYDSWSSSWDTHYYYSYTYEQYYRGWGGGLFIAPRIVSAQEVFKFVPGLNVGVWTYIKNEVYEYHDGNRWRYSTLGGDTEIYWGGPDIRFMIGYRSVYADLSYKVQLGMRDGVERRYNPFTGGTNTYYYSRFSARHLFGIGLSFAMGKGNW